MNKVVQPQLRVLHHLVPFPHTDPVVVSLELVLEVSVELVLEMVGRIQIVLVAVTFVVAIGGSSSRQVSPLTSTTGNPTRRF